MLNAVCSGIAWAETGFIYGRVLVAGSGMPVCPITVTVESNSEPLQKTSTMNDGSFHFLAVSPGTVKVTVGRSRAVRYVTVSADIKNHDTWVEPFYLSPLVTLTDTKSAQTRQFQNLCRGRRPFFSGYGASDYDPDP